MLPLFLCQNYLFIFLFWSRLGLSISDLALADSVYPCCHSLSDGVQFLNLHRFSLTPSWHALFLICSVLTVHHSYPLQPCHISSCSSYRFPFPAALLSTACTLLNIQNTALEGAMFLPLTRWSTAPPVCQAGTVNFKEGSNRSPSKWLKSAHRLYVAVIAYDEELLGWDTVHRKLKITFQKSTFYWESLSDLTHHDGKVVSCCPQNPWP